MLCPKYGKKGGEGGIALAEKVLIHWKTKNQTLNFFTKIPFLLEEKIEKIAKEIYGADGVVYEPAAKKQIAKIESLGFGSFRYVWQRISTLCLMMQKKLGRPHGFDIHIREVYVVPEQDL